MAWGKLPASWRQTFIGALRDVPNIQRACEIAGITHTTLQKYRRAEPEFNAACDAALQQSRRARLMANGRQRGGKMYLKRRRFYDRETPGAGANICESIKLDDVWPLEGEAKFLYLIRESWHNMIKVGITRHLKGRLSGIQCGMPQRCELLAFFATRRPRALERYVHVQFAEKRYSGEWFTLTVDDIDAIARTHRAFVEADGAWDDSMVWRADDFAVTVPTLPIEPIDMAFGPIDMAFDLPAFDW